MLERLHARRYRWSVTLAAFRRVVSTSEGRLTRAEAERRLRRHMAIEHAKRLALDGDTPAREWLTYVARYGDDEVYHWLIDHSLVAADGFGARS